MALIQHKQDLVKAIKAQQYIAAAAVLDQALAMAPEDALLLEFQAAVQAKLRLDHDVSSSAGDDDDDASEGSQNSDSDSSCAAGDEEDEDDSGSADEESTCPASGAEDDVDSSSADPTPSSCQ